MPEAAIRRIKRQKTRCSTHRAMCAPCNRSPVPRESKQRSQAGALQNCTAQGSSGQAELNRTPQPSRQAGTADSMQAKQARRRKPAESCGAGKVGAGETRHQTGVRCAKLPVRAQGITLHLRVSHTFADCAGKAYDVRRNSFHNVKLRPNSFSRASLFCRNMLVKTNS